MPSELTRPHDYRALLDSCPELTIVGGQAIAVWAIAYLDLDDASRGGLGSRDLDVVATVAVSQIIAALPGWKHDRPPLWAFRDTRILRLESRTTDGRLLVVEVLHKVLGLEEEDIDTVTSIEQGGITYRVLDPIAMLKAKAANVRELDQEGPPPRQDRAHLRIIAQCVAPFLRDAHAQAVGDAALHAKFAKTVSRAFRTMLGRRTLQTLLNEGFDPLPMLPEELSTSPISQVRAAFEHQLPRLARLISELRAKQRS